MEKLEKNQFELSGIFQKLTLSGFTFCVNFSYDIALALQSPFIDWLFYFAIGIVWVTYWSKT